MVAYLEGLTDRGIIWLDHTPSKENPSDIMTKSVTPADQFFRMRDVIMGCTPVLFVSAKVREICQSYQSTAPVSVSCYDKSGVLCIDSPDDIRSFSIPDLNFNGRKSLCESPTSVSEMQMGV